MGRKVRGGFGEKILGRWNDGGILGAMEKATLGGPPTGVRIGELAGGPGNCGAENRWK